MRLPTVRLAAGLLIAGGVLAAVAGSGPVAGSSSPSPSPSPSPGAVPVPAPTLGWEVVALRTHDTIAWTEGLLVDPDGRWWESTGLDGVSQVRELDPLTGTVLRAAPVPNGHYGEGLAMTPAGELIQLTWRSGVGYRWDPATLTVTGTVGYDGEGWGLCSDGVRLVRSDGSDTLFFHDPVSFAVTGTVSVTLDGEPLRMLNELDCVDGAVWANVWQTETIVRIDPATGIVTGRLDLDGLLVPDPSDADAGAVLNGIARLPETGTWLLTGKYWPELIEVRIEGT
jgi:hypothetical protein